MVAPNDIICDEMRREEPHTHATMKAQPAVDYFEPWKNTLCEAFFYYMFPIIYPTVGGLSLYTAVSVWTTEEAVIIIPVAVILKFSWGNHFQFSMLVLLF